MVWAMNASGAFTGLCLDEELGVSILRFTHAC